MDEPVELGGRPTLEELASQWLTVKESAALMRVHPMTVYRMIKRQEVRTLRMGPRQIRVLKADVERIMDTPEENK